MEAIRDKYLHQQLVNRRERLGHALSHSTDNRNLARLLQEVDAALERMDTGTYGICETCHDTIESERLLLNPLCRNCLDHLSAEETRSLERDLDLAYQIQRALLPRTDIGVDGWDIAYHYEAAGPVSGDYCDLILPQNGSGLFYLLVGDVSGKGVAASMLMAHLHATFRSLMGAGIASNDLVERANRIFWEGTLPSHFATLVCAGVQKNNEVEICNAGHCSPLVVRSGRVDRVQPHGLPLGLLGEETYASEKVQLAPGDALVLYTDGISESQDGVSNQYGEERLMRLLTSAISLSPGDLIKRCLEDVKGFRNGTAQSDDITMLVLQRKK